MGQFDRQIATAQRLIKKNGQLVVWRQAATPAVDGAEPWNVATAAPVDNFVFVCFVPVRDRESRKLIQYLTGTEVESGQTAGLMGAVGFEPTTKDVVIRDGKTLRIVSLDCLSPNGQKVLWIAEFAE